MFKKFCVRAGLTAMLVFSLMLTTCESLSSFFREPLLTLNSVELKNLNFTGTDLLCKVNVENPNAIDIPFPQIDWEFFINANSFVKGVIKNDKTIGARRTTVVDVPVSLNYLDVFNTFSSLKGSKQADYKVALAAKFNLPVLGSRVWNFAHEGIFPVLQIPKFSMPSMKIGRMDFTKAEIICSVNVENPNDFDLPSPKMAYDYLVNRNSFIKSSVGNAAPLAAASVTPVLVKLEVDYAELLKNFQALRNLGEVPSLFSMNSDFSIPAFSGETFLTEITGSLPILKAPSLSFSGISLKSLGLTKIDFDLTWEVENNNSFAMSLKDLSYNFAVNNSNWASGKIPGSPQIAANSKTKIPLTISISALSMVRDITEIITRGTEIAYSCGGNMNLGAALPGLSDFEYPFDFKGTTKLRN